MKTYPFELNTWITFEFEECFCIGKTIYKNGKEFIASATDNGQICFIPYYKINNPRKLKLLRNEPTITSNEKLNKTHIDFNIHNN